MARADDRVQWNLHGVEVGMEVVDAQGKPLGKVTRLDPWGVEVVRGFFSPREWVIGWHEVLEVSGGTVRVARSDDDLLELATGGLPPILRRGTPPREEPLDPLALDRRGHG
ncbi:MAG TPA: PRC-barrel domain-containing protein [Anaeromyxobacteraceae bacterium]